MEDSELIDIAEKACENSYSPYSHFKVGAALLCEDGSVFTGCNIENASYGAANCAERTAFFNAVSSGKKIFSKIAVVGILDETVSSFTPPCGICRQVMAEFCRKDFEIILYDGKDIKVIPFEELMPHPFCEF